MVNVDNRKALLVVVCLCLSDGINKRGFIAGKAIYLHKKENLFIAKPPLAYFAENQQC
jgi:hypothetical protein